MFKKFLILTIVLFVFSSFVTAQTGQTGKINGMVLFSGGAEPLPGVLVTIKSQALVIGKMITITNEKGKFTFHSLSPGAYEVTFEANGMAKTIQKNITVKVNETVTVNTEMQLKTIKESIIVTAIPPTIDTQSTTVNTSMTKEFIKSIPSARNLSNLINMAPGINGGVSLGAGERDNTYNLDGVNTNDPETGTNASSINMDIVEEVSIQTGAVSAEHQSGPGAVISVVTKSGGNKFSGSVTGFYSGEKLYADNSQKIKNITAPSISTSEIETSLTLGGALIKNKLWFFSSFKYYKDESTSNGFPKFGKTDIVKPDSNISPYFKLTYQPTQNDKVVASFNYYSRDQKYNTYAWWRELDSSRSLKVKSISGQLSWNHSFNSNLFTNFQLSYFSLKRDLVNNGDDNSSYYWDAKRQTAYGSSGSSDYNTRPRFQINFDGTYFLDDFIGSHELKFGVQFQKAGWTRGMDVHGSDDGHGLKNGWSYIYSWGVRKQYWADFESTINIQKLGFFINDSWLITNNLSATLGVRLDIESTIFPKSTGSDKNSAPSGNFGYLGVPSATWNMIVPQKTTAYTWNNISPRVGLIYDVFGKGKTLIKTNFSKYNVSNYSYYAAFLNPVNWVGYTAEYKTLDSLKPTYLNSTRVPGTNTEAGYKNHKLKAPVSYSVSLGLEQVLWEDWSVELRYTQRWDRDLIETVDGNQVNMDELMDNGKLIWDNWTPHTFTDPTSGNTLTAWSRNRYLPQKNYIVNPAGANRDYKGFEISIKKRLVNKWAMTLSYVNNNSKGLMNNFIGGFDAISSFYNNPNTHENAYGRLPRERKHEIKFTGMIKAPFGINLGAEIKYLTGYPYSRTIRPSEFGVPVGKSTTIFAESRGSYNYEDLLNINLKIEKRINFGSVSFNIFAEVFNLLNADTVTGMQENDNKNVTFGKIKYIVRPRNSRFGVRIEF